MELERHKIYLIALGILLIAVVVIAAIGAANYQKLIDQKEAEISKLSEQVFQKEADAQFWKSQAEEISKKVVAVSKKIEASKKVAAADKKKMDSVEAPQTSTEIAERLREQGYTPEVKCEQ